ncbi:DUF4126 domain-containing protein [Aureimonas phyllosphaerae]|uniref:DUF4126 domain-containing protein n=1 Tax=Aureimonas phyllosphaerae TaxID=1166078 RepID=UPI003A5BD318
MLAPLLIGLVAGQRAMTPLAVLAAAARRGALPTSVPGVRLLSVPLVATGAMALAGGEMAGDKMRTAPDRTVAAGLLARSMTAAFAGAVLAEPGRRAEGAAIAVAAAVGSSFLGLAIRKRAMARFGQTRTGLVEDAAVAALARAIVSRKT